MIIISNDDNNNNDYDGNNANDNDGNNNNNNLRIYILQEWRASSLSLYDNGDRVADDETRKDTDNQS